MDKVISKLTNFIFCGQTCPWCYLLWS